MGTFLSNNAGTILTGIVLIVIVTAVIFKIRKDKDKKGDKCANCPYECGIKREI
ncbi:hypothetical protein R84B8_02929 [Treponema sp. R8-4-B8]